jgi:hypothetical protein
LQKLDIVTLFLGVYLGIQKFRARNPVYQEVDSCIKNALKLTYEHLEHHKKFPGTLPADPQEKEGKGRDVPPRENPAYATAYRRPGRLVNFSTSREKPMDRCIYGTRSCICLYNDYIELIWIQFIASSAGYAAFGKAYRASAFIP